MIRNIFLGFIRIHILYHASKDEIFGVEIMQELKKHGYSISPGTLYPILHSLENQKYLTSRKEVVRGKIRKYYFITQKGSSILNKSKIKIKELVNEVFEE
ncbi:PadR family transcriptional regulator [bacterium]|nr:PadR family transcriptional regulator [bacterium]